LKNTVKVERARLDMTQQELANKVDVSRKTIVLIEAGGYDPSITLALKIAGIFNKKVDEIFELEDEDWVK